MKAVVLVDGNLRSARDRKKKTTRLTINFTVLQIGHFCPVHAEKILTFSAALIRVNGGYVIQPKYDVSLIWTVDIHAKATHFPSPELTAL